MAQQGPLKNYHHIGFFVSNALQACFWALDLGQSVHFRPPSGTASISALNVLRSVVPNAPTRRQSAKGSSTTPTDAEGVGREVAMHGDFVKDVAYSVDNLGLMLECLAKHGQRILEPRRECRDQHGSLLIARICGSGGTIVHTLVQNINYQGPLLPGFKPIQNFPACETMPAIPFYDIDHVVEAHPEHSLEAVTEWYQRILGLHRFWSIDDKLVHAEFSALRAALVGNSASGEGLKITLVEPANVNGGRRRGQVQEFLDSHGQSGVQHIAFLTDDIVGAVRELRGRGVDFLPIPGTYYDMLELRLRSGGPTGEPIREDLAKIRELGILVDFDDGGYLLQIFTKPVQDRATLFLEIIQRRNFNGFGAGNFKALFAAVELEQKRRDEEMNGTGEF